jgi:hypothetical protein
MHHFFVVRNLLHRMFQCNPRKTRRVPYHTGSGERRKLNLALPSPIFAAVCCPEFPGPLAHAALVLRSPNARYELALLTVNGR